MSTDEIQKLKEELKQEILAEMKQTKGQDSVWKKISKEFKDDFNKFDYIEHWECINSKGDLVSRDFSRNVGNNVKSAIGNILKTAYKVDTAPRVKEDYERVKTAVQDILNILERERKYKEGHE